MEIYDTVDDLFSAARAELECSKERPFYALSQIIGASAYLEGDAEQRFEAEVRPYLLAKLPQSFADFQRTYTLVDSPHKTTAACRPFGKTLKLMDNSTSYHELVKSTCHHEDFASYTGINLSELRPTNPKKLLAAFDGSRIQDIEHLELSFNAYTWRDDLKDPDKRFARYRKVLEQLLLHWRDTLGVLVIRWFSETWNDQGMNVFNEVILDCIAKLPNLKRLEIDLHDLDHYNATGRDDIIEPLFTRDDFTFTQLAIYRAPEWAHRRVLECFESNTPGSERITGLLLGNLSNESFSALSASAALSNLSERFFYKDILIKTWQTQGWEQDAAIEEAAAGDEDATSELRELRGVRIEGFGLEQMRALLGEDPGDTQLPMLARVYLDDQNVETMTHFFARAPTALPNLRMLRLNWCEMPELGVTPVWPSLEQLSVRLMNGASTDTTHQLFSADAFPSLTAIRLEGGPRTLESFLKHYASWENLEKVMLDTSGIPLVEAFDASVEAGLFEGFEEPNLYWAAGNGYHDKAEAAEIVARLQDAEISLHARRQLVRNYLSPRLDRPLLYKLLKEMGAKVTTRTRHSELGEVYNATMPAELTTIQSFKGLDRWLS